MLTLYDVMTCALCNADVCSARTKSCFSLRVAFIYSLVIYNSSDFFHICNNNVPIMYRYLLNTSDHCGKLMNNRN